MSRPSQRQTVWTSHVEFAEPIQVGITDRIELDYKRGIAHVIDTYGKVREKVPFKEFRPDGTAVQAR